MTDKTAQKKFTAYSLLLILLIAISGIAISVLGVERMISNEVGGGTFLLLGVILIVTSILITVGIATTRIDRITKRYHNLSSYVGKNGIVKEKIPAGGRGVVLVENELWTAFSNDEINEGELVTIVNIEGVTLIVRRQK
jgi:Membrane protein implicated in regulation of membrane protease activity